MRYICNVVIKDEKYHNTKAVTIEKKVFFIFTKREFNSANSY